MCGLCFLLIRHHLLYIARLEDEWYCMSSTVIVAFKPELRQHHYCDSIPNIYKLLRKRYGTVTLAVSAPLINLMRC